ncbi:hypothetical protein DERF_001590 [Dermatophagoides farinae]|uniref:Uncharacterized protein n=1 Tax=Dermatophagoides farinae TaxID=6954 RepID=A0A922IF93_DERFA|nr:hypothetical protein DERF_001590 [Dermatophagoides farinae]
MCKKEKGVSFSFSAVLLGDPKWRSIFSDRSVCHRVSYLCDVLSFTMLIILIDYHCESLITKKSTKNIRSTI